MKKIYKKVINIIYILLKSLKKIKNYWKKIKSKSTLRCLKIVTKNKCYLSLFFKNKNI